MEITELKKNMKALQDNIEKVIVGKRSVIELVLTALLAKGNLLLEDTPGTGKTMLAKSLAKSISGEFKRIQFTADLLPSDVTGLHFFNQKTGEFILQKGPVFANIVLADEINRATPRTQSSLLECMEERQVSLDGETMQLAEPFLVIATENPIETAGTFPLPEAQLDRFMMQLQMGFPEYEEELELMDRFLGRSPYENLQEVISCESLVEMQDTITRVHLEQEVREYLLKIVKETRENRKIKYGVSPRGTLAFLRASQAYAALQGRDYVVPEDVKYLAPFVLGHRIVLLNGYTEHKDAVQLIRELVDGVSVPTEQFS